MPADSDFTYCAGLPTIRVSDDLYRELNRVAGH